MTEEQARAARVKLEQIDDALCDLYASRKVVGTGANARLLQTIDDLRAWRSKYGF